MKYSQFSLCSLKSSLCVSVCYRIVPIKLDSSTNVPVWTFSHINANIPPKIRSFIIFLPHSHILEMFNKYKSLTYENISNLQHALCI